MARERDKLDQSDHHNARGIELADRGWLDEAIGEFERAIEMDPTSAHARDNLGTVLAEKGRLGEALVQYVEAVKVDPESPSTHHYLASFLAAHGNQLALAEYQEAVEREFEFPDAHLNRGLLLADAGDLEEALGALRIAHEQAPEDAVIRHELACCLIDMERHADAIGHLKSLIKSDPEHVEAHVDLGIAFTAQGFLNQAESAFEKAIDIDPYDFSGHYHLAGLQSLRGDAEQAVYHLERAAGRDHEKARAWTREDRLFDSIRDNPAFQKLWHE